MADKKPPLKRETPGQTADSGSTGTPTGTDIERSDGRPDQKARAAVELRLRHASWLEIAETLEYASPRAAQDAVEKAIAYLAGPPETYIAMQRQMGMELDLVLRSLAPKAMSRTLQVDDPRDADKPASERRKITVANEEHLAYSREYRAALEQKARLFGLNAPTRVQVDTPGSKELDEIVSTIVVAHRGELPPEGNPFDMELDADGVYVLAGDTDGGT